MELIAEYIVENVQIFVYFERQTPHSWWKNRYNNFFDYVNSQRIYNSMSYEDKQVLVERIKNSLEVLYDNVEEWLPDAFKEFEPGNRIVVEMSMQVIDHEKTIKRKSAELSLKVRDARRELKKLIEEEALNEDKHD